MICPECHCDFDIGVDSEQPVFHCPQCAGTWIGGRSLHAMLARTNDSASIEEVLDSILELDFRESRRQCPRCAPRHLKMVVIEDTELDFCSRCKGLFFDPGELDQVLPAIVDGSASYGRTGRSARRDSFWTSLMRMLDSH